MRKLITIAAVLAAVTALPAVGQANLHELRFNHFVRYEADTECAAEAEIVADDGGLINGTEALRFDGVEVANLSGLPFQSGYSAGDRILFASSSFASKLNLQLEADYDVEVADQDCAGLMDNSTISFRSSFGNDIGGFQVGTLKLMQAWSYNDATDDYEEADLSLNSITLSGLNNSWDLGAGPLLGGGSGGGPNGGGCALARQGTSTDSALIAWALLGGGLALVRWRRRKQ